MQPLHPRINIIDGSGFATCGIVTVEFEGQTYKVGQDGGYEQIVELPLSEIRKNPTEPIQNQAKVHRYAQMYRSGSPFPPISVIGVWPGRSYYRICNGHHRYEAAKLAGCKTIRAWTDFSAPVPGCDFYRPARLPDTGVGQRIAAHLGWEWCPECTHFTLYDPKTQVCRRCETNRAAMEARP